MHQPTEDRPVRVLHCPTVVGGHAPALARAERCLGLQSWAVVFENSYAGYLVDETLYPVGTHRFRREVRRWALLLRALRHFDAVHFNYGSSLMPRRYPIEGRVTPARRLADLYARLVELRDLGWLKRAGKGVFVTYHGDDARPAEFTQALAMMLGETSLLPHTGSEWEDAKRRGIAAFDRAADRIYALNPDLLRALPSRAQFLPYAHVDLEHWLPAQRGDRTGPPVVAHAPTDRLRKGTRYLLEAVDRLHAEGVRFEFELVERHSQDDARRVYERCDLLVDQLLAGWYGGVAVELMALGKPVVAYIREDDLGFIPDPMHAQIPVICANPATIYDVLKDLLTTRRKQLPELGARSRAYVERWHDPVRIATRLKGDYERSVAKRQ